MGAGEDADRALDGADLRRPAAVGADALLDDQLAGDFLLQATEGVFGLRPPREAGGVDRGAGARRAALAGGGGVAGSGAAGAGADARDAAV